MPQPSRHTTFSTESLSALLDALGLSKFGDDEEEAHCINLTYARSRCVYPERRSVAAGQAQMQSCDNYDFIRPTSPVCLEKLDDYSLVEKEDSSFIDISELGQNYLSDICPDLDFESDSDCELNTLPSRPGSSLDGFEYLPSTLSPPPSATFSVRCMGTEISSQASSLQSSPASPRFPSQQHHYNPHHSAPETAMISIKAALNATILMLRVPATISLSELKKRLYDKFLKQEGVRLSRDFSVVHVQPPVGYGNTRGIAMDGIMMEQSWGRSSNDQKMLRRAIPFSDRTEMKVVDADLDWRRIVKVQSRKADGSKVTLRIVDTPSF
ncbi:hypothetical protein CVT24_003453 [Panaeolus cyanescens]|uniref:Uncharacterized protein n=1 Tax=Panaeolus cyanescens TaxID=181874 RepID=A0A409Y6U8_9AGAR|nr:hypothetical protein CVT24_003453 [Panaeolus cyanescens]